jgi:hypothetical protein
VTQVRLSDKDFLEDYICFGVWQPATFSVWLTNQLSPNGGFNKAAALQIYLNFEIALEMMAMWYFALGEWSPGRNSLARKFTNVKISGETGNRYNVADALSRMISMSPDELFAHLKQPTRDQLAQRGWTEAELRGRDEVALKLPGILQSALKNRVASNGDLVRAYNKLKHGLFVFQELAGERGDGVALIHSVHADDASGVMVEPIWMPTTYERLRAITDITVVVCKLAAALLEVVPWYYYSDEDRQAYRQRPSATGSMIKVYEKIEEMWKPGAVPN